MTTFRVIPIVDGIKLFECVIDDFANKTHSRLFTIVFHNKMSCKIYIWIASSILIGNCITPPGILIKFIFSKHIVDTIVDYGTRIDMHMVKLIFCGSLIFLSIAGTVDKMLLKSSMYISISILINGCTAASIIVIKFIDLTNMINIVDAGALSDNLVNMAIEIKNLIAIYNNIYSTIAITAILCIISAVIHSIQSIFAVLKLISPVKAQNKIKTQS